MTNPQSNLTKRACLEALRNQQQNLAETISRLVTLMKTLPEGDAWDQFPEEISCLDMIAEVSGRVEGAI
jgi:hypothetical protein